MSAVVVANMLGVPELVIILLIVVVIFGVGKLPEIGKHLGAGIKNFKNEVNDGNAPEQLPADSKDSTPSTPRDVTDEHRA
jgi:sec-independent protein translocase protein TatA